MKDYYKILDISKNATPEEIKSSFRSKAKIYHPDVNKSPGAHENFISIGEAYEILYHADSRRQYDSLTYVHSSSSAAADDFNTYQQSAYRKAQTYSDTSLEELLGSILKFTYELGRAAIFGERDKPKITFGDYIKMGFYGILLTFCIIISFTGIGTIPGIVIGIGIVNGMRKNGKMIGIVPLLISTVVADLIVVLLLLSLLSSLFQ